MLETAHFQIKSHMEDSKDQRQRKKGSMVLCLCVLKVLLIMF